MTDPLAALRVDPSGLSAAEARLAQRIAADPTIVVDLAITDLAVLCETSPATVARFAQTLGFSGYRQFRMEVAQAVSREQADRERFGIDDEDILADDDAGSVASKIAYQEMRAIEQTAHGLDPRQVDEIAALIGAATRTDVFAMGASALAAVDLYLKLVRIGHTAWHGSDVHLALVQAAQRGPGDVVVGISHSGTTREVIEPMEIARAAGATTVAITNAPDSAITHRADHVLLTKARESPFRIGAMGSRIAQLAVIDILFTRVVQAHGDSVRTALQRTREVIETHNLGAD
ncbi:MurR/RpiR family transcriptional regulator [Microbacterium sp. NPDC057659]|uniref:MurR/RpiR family transcriptional regulator n=1 Tax=Microbacterium sp. NPDC057659 TaxID=3346198 RepID=UPI00366F2DB3